MEFHFRAGDRRPGSPFPARFSTPRDRRFSPQAGPLHGEPPPPASFEWEAAAWRERIVSMEVERRLIEEACLIEGEVRRELAVARVRFLGVFGPAPLPGPDGPFVPPLPPPPPPGGMFFGLDGLFPPPVPLPLMPVGMQPKCPPPASFGECEGFDGRVGFEQTILVKRTPLPQLKLKLKPKPKLKPKQKPKHKLKLHEIGTSKS